MLLPVFEGHKYMPAANLFAFIIIRDLSYHPISKKTSVDSNINMFILSDEGGIVPCAYI